MVTASVHTPSAHPTHFSENQAWRSINVIALSARAQCQQPAGSQHLWLHPTTLLPCTLLMLPLLLCWVFELLLLLSQAFAGIVTVSVGHCHPEVVAAINKQNELLQHTTTIYLNNQIAEYAKELADKMPGNLKVIQPRL